MSNDEENEARILEIMKEKNCSYENAKSRLMSRQNAVFALNPQLYKPIPPIPKPQPQVEEVEETTEPIDEIAETKLRILQKLENQIDFEDEFSDLLSDPQWRNVFAKFVVAIKAVANGECGYYVQVVTPNGEGKVNVTSKFTDKDGSEIEPITLFRRMQSELYLGKTDKEGKND